MPLLHFCNFLKRIQKAKILQSAVLPPKRKVSNSGREGCQIPKVQNKHKCNHALGNRYGNYVLALDERQWLSWWWRHLCWPKYLPNRNLSIETIYSKLKFFFCCPVHRRQHMFYCVCWLHSWWDACRHWSYCALLVHDSGLWQIWKCNEYVIIKLLILMRISCQQRKLLKLFGSTFPLISFFHLKNHSIRNRVILWLLNS